jgi:hypothetical protein
MEFSPETLVTIAIMLLVEFVILRWIFSVDRHLKNQRATIWFLMKIAEKQGLTKDEISGAINTFDIK